MQYTKNDLKSALLDKLALTMGTTISGRTVATAQALTVLQYGAMPGQSVLTSVGISTAHAMPTTAPEMAPALVGHLPSVP